MLRLLTLLLLVSPAIARETTGDGKKGEGMLGLLPDGSQLKGIMIPRYDENRKLVGVLRSKVMTLVNAGQMAGKEVTVELYNADQTSRGHINLNNVNFFEEKDATGKGNPPVTKQLLVADEAVEIKIDGMTTHGTGLHFDFLRGKGFLHGPGTTTLPENFKTTMKSKPVSLRATAAASLALATAIPATAEEKPEVASPSQAAAITEAGKATRAELREALEKSADATRAATEFLDQQDLLAAGADANPSPTPVPQPPDTAPDKNGGTIDFDGGFYFDMETGQGTFLKNVRASTLDFDLTGADEVKLFFGKKPEKPEKPGETSEADKSKKPFGDFGGKVGDLERIVATGGILIKQKNLKAGELPAQVSGRVFTYNVKTEEIIVSGGPPWFSQGNAILRGTKDGNMVRVTDFKNFKISTPGGGFQLYVPPEVLKKK